MEKIIIKVDSAESGCQIPKLLQSESVAIELLDLESGDYAFGHVGIERKSANDFIASIIDRRMFSQAPILRSAFETPIILIEGDIYNVDRNVDHAAITGALSYLAVIERLTIIHSKDQKQSAEMISTMARHAVNGLGYIPSLRSAKPSALPIQQAYFVEGLPAIGSGKARQLLEHFGTIHAIINSTKSELLEIDGMGPKTADKILEVVHANYQHINQTKR